IPGNIQADHAAKEAQNLVPFTTSQNSLSTASANSWLKEQVENSRKDYWQPYAPASYRALGIKSFTPCPQELTLPRSIIAHIYAARTGHEENSAHTPRTILNPVAPSKRAAQYFTDATSQSPRNEAHQTPAYLPKELQAIIQRRQDQERAWHVRISKCSSVICNVESSLEMFKRDIEKQEAEFKRDYIRIAIARLAASDNSPKPPLNLMNTKPPQTKDRFQEKD
ncbi:hypothetical protein EPUL_002700, partial [Erysiphe pulchra]